MKNPFTPWACEVALGVLLAVVIVAAIIFVVCNTGAT